MMHIRTGNRHGSTALGYLFLPFIAIAAGATYVDAQPRAFVANTKLNTVTVIDGAATSSIGVGLGPTQLAIGPDGTVYVANSGDNTISVIDAKDLAATPITIPLTASPTSLAITPKGDRLYVMDAAGFLESFDTTTNASLTPVFIGGDRGRIAITPKGDRIFVASELVSVVNTADNTLGPSFPVETDPNLPAGNFAVDVAIGPDGRVFVAVVTYHYDWMGFRADGGLAVFDGSPDTPTLIGFVPLFSLPNSLALSADGTRAFVGIQSYWADTLYGAAFLPGHWVATIDATSNATIAWTDLGADSVTWAGTHTPAGLAVTPDRSAVFVSIPNTDTVAKIDVDTSAITESFVVEGGGPTGVAVPPNASATPRPFTIGAVDDGPGTPVSELATGVAIGNVLANDTVGGGPATTSNVVLSFVSASSTSVTLDAATGAVWVAADAAVGAYSLTYRICDTAHADNCGQAVAHVVVRPRFNLVAGADGGDSYAGVKAIANVLGNDTVDGVIATLADVSLSTVTSDAGISLNGDGSVAIAAGAAPGARALAYQICDVTSPGNCASASVTVTVIRRPINAAPDSGSAARTGGTAVANVLANDAFEDGTATLGRVTLTFVSSTDAGVTLNTATGAVSVASGAAPGLQTLTYQICEAASPDNCSDGTVSVTVKATLIVAVGESARASNKNASTPIRNVLANDSLGGAPATLANVILSQVSTSNAKVRLNPDGSVSVADKAGSSASLVYQICEIGSPSNCARATVSVDLSGKN